MKKDHIYRSRFLVILPIGVLFSLLVFSKSYKINNNFDHKLNSEIENKTTRLQLPNAVDNKQRGAHVFGYLDSTNLRPFIQNNFDWITMVSYGVQDDYDSPTMGDNRGDSLEVVRRESIWKGQIDIAHSSGFKVFMKPHVWVHNTSGGKWRSDIFPANEDNWKLWENNYREYILLYANIAAQNNVEMFCIGTELSRLSVEKTDFWEDLIREVRTIYSGKITYAANWNTEFEEITFWDKLDYIGIQAYFPLVRNKYPTVEQLSKGWDKYSPAMEAIHKKYNLKILFTEMGYKSTADSAIEPWEWIENYSNADQLVSTETQANCYRAFFNTIWRKEWFAGVHIWQLRSDYGANGLKNKMDFTPQGKPAENVIAKGFE